MGGSGSGAWQRRKRGTVEHHWPIRIGELHRAGALAAGTEADLIWGDPEAPTGSIGLMAERERITLRYEARYDSGRATERFEVVARLDWTPCNFGGARPWFRCPTCARRVAVLFVVSTYIRCRHCARLSYSSQREVRTDRLNRRSDRLWRQLDWGRDAYGYPDKPKGMHWSTYARLVKQAERWEMLALVLETRKSSLLRGWFGAAGVRLLRDDAARGFMKRTTGSKATLRNK